MHGIRNLVSPVEAAVRIRPRSQPRDEAHSLLSTTTDPVKDTIYLVCSRSGVDAMRKSKTDLKSGQRGVRLTVDIPDKHFDQPFADAELSFSEKDVDRPEAHVQVQESRQWMERTAEQMLHRLTPEAHDKLCEALNRRMPDLGQKVKDWSLSDLGYSQLAVVIEEAEDRLDD